MLALSPFSFLKNWLILLAIPMASKLLLLIEITGGELTEFFDVGAQNTTIDLTKNQNQINVNTFDDILSDVEAKQNGILTCNFTPWSEN